MSSLPCSCPAASAPADSDVYKLFHFLQGRFLPKFPLFPWQSPAHWLGWTGGAQGTDFLPVSILSWALLFSLQTQLWKHLGIFWKFPGEPQNQSHGLEVLDQSKGLWGSVTVSTCVGGRKGQVKAFPAPVLLSFLCCQLELSCPASVSISLRGFSCVFVFPTYLQC